MYVCMYYCISLFSFSHSVCYHNIHRLLHQQLLIPVVVDPCHQSLFVSLSHVYLLSSFRFCFSFSFVKVVVSERGLYCVTSDKDFCS